MKLMTILATLALTGFAASCDYAAPAAPADNPLLAKPGACPGHPSCKDGDGVSYQFEYAMTVGQFGSDCEKKSPEEVYGKTNWCYGETPTFAVHVARSDAQPVTSGIVTFKRCVDLRDGTVQDWVRCGVLQRKNRRFFGGVYYGEAEVGDDGIATLTLVGWVQDQSVWGMHWEYDVGDGKKPEASIKWRDLAYVGYSNPPAQ
jgi:hypothetical protein